MTHYYIIYLIISILNTYYTLNRSLLNIENTLNMILNIFLIQVQLVYHCFIYSLVSIVLFILPLLPISVTRFNDFTNTQ